MRRLATSRRLPGSGRDLMAAFAADPSDWPPDPARRRGLDRWTVDLVAGPLTRSVACHVGSLWRAGDAAWRSVSWEPQPEPEDVVAVDRVLPVFSGQLRMESVGNDALLTLRGSYNPPASFIGAAADAVALHRVARTTADHFLADVARRLPHVLRARTDPKQGCLATSSR